MVFPKGLTAFANISEVMAQGAVKGNSASNITANNLAFKNAFLDALSKSSRSGYPRKIFVENGFYCVSEITSRVAAQGLKSNGVDYYDSDGWRYGMQIAGESVEGTILYLPPNTPGFQDLANPKPLIITGSEKDPQDDNQRNPTGEGNIAFRYYFDNLTIIIGAGNPACMAMDLVINNRGGMQNVRIIDEGNDSFVGIALYRDWAGPSLFENVYIEGFEYGIRSGGTITSLGPVMYDYQQTICGLTLVNPRSRGIYTSGLTVAIEGLTYYGSNDIAIDLNSSVGLSTIVDATFYGPIRMGNGRFIAQASTSQASKTAISGSTSFFLQRITNEAFEKTLVTKSLVTPITKTDRYLEEFRSSSKPNLITQKTYPSLKLKGRPTPVIYSTTMSDYANVTAFKQTPTEAAELYIQRAINNVQEPILIFPNARYTIAQTLVLKSLVGNKKLKLWGMSAQVSSATGFTDYHFKVDMPSANETIILEDIRFGKLLHNSPGTLTLKRCELVFVNNTEQGNGWTFLHDVMAIINFDYPHHLNGRQLNSEFQSPNFKFRGGTCWLLSLKTEASSGLQSVNLDIANCSRVVIQNANIFPLKNLIANPSIKIVDSDVDLFHKHSTGTYKHYIYDSQKGLVKQTGAIKGGFYSTRVIPG